jgi:hypothetical protein
MRLLRVRLLFVSVLSFSLALNGLIAAHGSETLTTLAPPKAPTSALPPKMVNPLKAKSITVKLKSAVVFTVKSPEIWRGKVVNSKIAKFVPGGPVSSYETYPSLTLRSKGKTSISLTDGKKTYLLKLTVS